MEKFKSRKRLFCNVFGVVDVALVRELIARIEAIPAAEDVEVCLRINSQGGSVPVALAFAGYLKSLPHRVVAINMAQCDSAAMIIYSAAEERIVLKSASFMFHQPFVHLNGKFTVHDLNAELKRLKKDAKNMLEFLSKMLSIEQIRLAEWMEGGERVFSARQALRVGIATVINPGTGVSKGTS